ncbi:uncharacterized protein LOC143071030 [Mytilus galloprovincialis]|uniref:uncharacterized protein LOC143071030 n=1 Tax=Mytilus galloprovincialis TaxID=29158 RepID=UPI003F7BACCD
MRCFRCNNGQCGNISHCSWIFLYYFSKGTYHKRSIIKSPFINYTHPHTKPAAAPSNIHASIKRITSLTISWDALNVFTKNGDVKGYKVYYRGPGLIGTQFATVPGEANREYTVTGLRPNSTYQFILQVVNDVGPGPYSGFIPISTLPSATTTSTPLPTTTTTVISTMTTTSTTTKTATKPTKTTTTTTIPKTTSTTTSKSTTQRTTRFERQKNPSSQIIITTTLPRMTHTAVTTLNVMQKI